MLLEIWTASGTVSDENKKHYGRVAERWYFFEQKRTISLYCWLKTECSNDELEPLADKTFCPSIFLPFRMGMCIPHYFHYGVLEADILFLRCYMSTGRGEILDVSPKRNTHRVHKKIYKESCWCLTGNIIKNGEIGTQKHTERPTWEDTKQMNTQESTARLRLRLRQRD